MELAILYGSVGIYTVMNVYLIWKYIDLKDRLDKIELDLMQQVDIRLKSAQASRDMAELTRTAFVAMMETAEEARK